MADIPESTSTTPAGQEVERWQHVKRGTVYEVIGRAELQMSCDLLVDGSEMVVYRGEDGKLWCREVSEFEDGRFVRLSTPSVAIGAGEVTCPKCGGDWCSVDLCLPATPSKAWSTSAAVEQKSWTGDPHGLANELRRCANLWREGFRLPQLLRDAADEIDCLAPGGTPASASIPADVEREANHFANAGNMADEALLNAATVALGNLMNCRIDAETGEPRERRIATLLAAERRLRAALATRPSTVERDNDGQKGGGE